MIKMRSGVKKTTNLEKYTYASIDIETLGLDSDKHKVLEVGVVLDNHLHRIDYSSINDYIKELPCYHCYIRHDSYDGDPYAVEMNKDIIDTIESNASLCIINEDQLAASLDMFFTRHLLSNGKPVKIMPAGKNFGGFDKQFLIKIPKVKEVLDKWLIHRTLDPAMYFFDENVDDRLPNLETCLQRANFYTGVKHTAPEDAYDVVRCLRYEWDYNPLKNM